MPSSFRVSSAYESSASEPSTSGSGKHANPPKRSGRACTSSAESSLQRRARARARRSLPMCTPGVLIDVTATAREVGFKYPTAVTSAVWANYVRVPEGVTGQDEQGRLHDILWMARLAISRGPEAM